MNVYSAKRHIKEGNVEDRKLTVWTFLLTLTQSCLQQWKLFQGSIVFRIGWSVEMTSEVMLMNSSL